MPHGKESRNLKMLNLRRMISLVNQDAGHYITVLGLPLLGVTLLPMRALCFHYLCCNQRRRTKRLPMLDSPPFSLYRC